MPLLSDADLIAMRTKIRHCPECLEVILKNYCRECDEFFEHGHLNNCKDNRHQHEKHFNHRTY